MVFGYIWGKRYSRAQVFSVALLTAGVVLSAWADADAKGKTHKSSPQTLYSFGTGLAILFLAQLLSAWMGLYVEATYQKYGNHWRENFFYSHLLSLPLFTPFLPTLWKQLRKLAASPPLIPSSQLYDIIPYSLSKMILSVPSQILFLGINSITQYACIRGVSLLASQSTALTVTIVLNVRKLASLLLSIWLFENKLAPGIVVGAGIVFGSGALYGWESQRIRKRAQAAGKANGALLEATVEKRS
ncbi:MAG: golgi uridine diphosphate-N- acetylglucosamine transporter [Vezdaea aestivalis]|nr:MAG: golgi uridine diphosphate-N- acetylglucosamine transporter [Vezdaea aestivalis]